MNRQYKTEKKISSFDKSISSNIFFTKPDKYKLLEDATYKSDTMINIGSNLSYSPLGFFKDSLSININNFNRILNFDIKNKRITVEAGITLFELLNFTLSHNLWIPQLPGYPLITVGGAVAANSHGKSCAIHGTIRRSIESILLFHKTHGWMNLSEEENKEIFDLTIGGLGLTGSIVSVTLNLINIKSTKFVTQKKIVKTVKETKNILRNNKDYSYIYSWNRADSYENFGEGIIYKNLEGDQLEDFQKLKEIKNNFKPFLFSLWNKYSVRIVNFFYLNINKFSKSEKKEDFLKVIFPFYGKENYFNFFGKNGFIESQLLIHEKNLELFIDEFKILLKKYDPTITLFSLKNMSGQQKYLRFEDNKVCLTFDYINTKKNLIFMSKIDDLYSKYQILPSIVKDSRISKEIFNNCYKEESSNFKEKLRSFDKKRVYRSEISNRLEI